MDIWQIGHYTLSFQIVTDYAIRPMYSQNLYLIDGIKGSAYVCQCVCAYMHVKFELAPLQFLCVLK